MKKSKISIEIQISIIKDYNNKMSPKNICKKYNIKYSLLSNLLFRKDVYKIAKRLEPINGFYLDSVEPFSGEKKKRYFEEYSINNKDTIRNSAIRYKYGITLYDYQLMLEKQNNCCAICGLHKDNFKNNLCIDHDHKTGEIRGLICSACNKGLGHFRDNKEFLKNAIEYLKNHEEGATGTN